MTSPSRIEVLMELELTNADSGGRRTVEVGDSLSIALAESPTTGYRWYADIDSTALRQTGDEFEVSTDRRGAAGTRRLTFTTLRPGATPLKLVKRRSWETTVVDEFTLDLDAH